MNCTESPLCLSCAGKAARGWSEQGKYMSVKGRLNHFSILLEKNDIAIRIPRYAGLLKAMFES